MTPEQRPYRMVVALDESKLAHVVLEHALDLSVRHPQVDLHFVTVVSDESEVDAGEARLATELLDGGEAYHDAAAGGLRVRLHVRVGKTVDEIVGLAREVDADLLVIGRFGAHSRHRSLASAIVDASPCPTLVVGLTERHPPVSSDARAWG